MFRKIERKVSPEVERVSFFWLQVVSSVAPLLKRDFARVLRRIERKGLPAVSEGENVLGSGLSCLSNKVVHDRTKFSHRGVYD